MAEQRGRLHVLVEGQTEETIVRDVIGRHLSARGWWVSQSMLKTRRPSQGPAFKGGVTSWAKVERDIRLLLQDSDLAVLTTVLDFYGFPPDAPGMSDRSVGNAIDRVTRVERALADHFGDQRFVPHLVLHETEAWVFAAGEQLAELYDDKSMAGKLAADVDAAGGAELINDNPTTAPSKRLIRYRPGYVKTLDGPLAIADLGLARLRARCPHLNAWLVRLEAEGATPVVRRH